MVIQILCTLWSLAVDSVLNLFCSCLSVLGVSPYCHRLVHRTGCSWPLNYSTLVAQWKHPTNDCILFMFVSKEISVSSSTSEAFEDAAGLHGVLGPLSRDCQSQHKVFIEWMSDWGSKWCTSVHVLYIHTFNPPFSLWIFLWVWNLKKFSFQSSIKFGPRKTTFKCIQLWLFPCGSFLFGSPIVRRLLFCKQKFASSSLD